MTAPRRRPNPTPAARTPAAPKRRWYGAIVVGLGLGFALAAVVDHGRGERWRAEAVLGLIEREAGRDLAIEQRLVATADFRATVAAELEPSTRAALARPSPLRRLAADTSRTVTAAVERLAGPSLAQSLNTRLALNPDPAAKPRALDLDAALAGDGRTLVLAARAGDPAAAAALAETAAATLVADRAARWRDELKRRLATTTTALDQTRDRIAATERRRARGSDDAVAAARAALADVEARLERARARLAVLRADRRELAAAAASPLDIATLSAHPRGDAVARAARARERAAARVAELDDTYGERHPVMVDAAAELEARRARQEAAATALVQAAERAVRAQARTVAELEEARATRREALAERAAAAAERADLAAEIRRQEEHAATLADRRAELTAALAGLDADARVVLVGDPVAADGGVATAAVYGGGAAGGLVLGGLVGLFRRGRLPRRVAGPSDVASVSALPLLAEVGPLRPGDARRRDDGVERLALRLEGHPQPTRSLAVLAAADGPLAGRLAAALGRALAHERHRTVVVALAPDPTLLPAPSRRDGAADLDAVLRGEAAWRDALRPLGEAGPWLMAPRAPVSAPGPALDRLLDDLARHFDRVLVAAGGLERAETLRVARQCRGALVAVVRGRTGGRALARGLDDLEAVGASVEGLVLVAG